MLSGDDKMFEFIKSEIVNHNKGDYARIFENRSTKEQGRSFAEWYFDKVEMPFLEGVDDYRDCLTDDAGGDGRIDAFYFDEIEDTLYLYEFKYRDNLTIADNEVDNFATIVDNFYRGDGQIWLESHKQIDIAVKNRITNFLSRENTKICFKFISTISEKNRDSIREKFKRYRNQESFDLEVYGIKDIYNKFDNKCPDVVIKIHENKEKGLYKDDQFIEYEPPKSGKKAYIINLRGDILVDQFFDNEKKSYYFKDNLRFGLNNKANKEISNTAEDSPEKFWLYNNGVTIICDNAEFISQQTAIKLVRPQIINGAQTVKSLSKVSKEKLENVRVLTRIIYGQDSETTVNVIQYNNTQTSIQSWQFYSNEPLWAGIDGYTRKTTGNKLGLEYKMGMKKVADRVVRLDNFILAYSSLISKSPSEDNPRCGVSLSKQGKNIFFKKDSEGYMKLYDLFPKDMLRVDNFESLPTDIKERYRLTMVLIDSIENTKKKVKYDNKSGMKNVKIIPYFAKKIKEDRGGNNSIPSSFETLANNSKYHIIYVLKLIVSKSVNGKDDSSEFFQNFDYVISNIEKFIEYACEKILYKVWQDDKFGGYRGRPDDVAKNNVDYIKSIKYRISADVDNEEIKNLFGKSVCENCVISENIQRYEGRIVRSGRDKDDNKIFFLEPMDGDLKIKYPNSLFISSFNDDIGLPKEGDQVDFILGENYKGPCAKDVRISE